MTAVRRRILLLTAIAIVGLVGQGCVPRSHQLRPDPLAGAGIRDMHERLALVIARDGYEHGLRTRQLGKDDVDSLYVRIPLDGLRRRHPSLEKLMQDLGALCRLPEFIDLPIRVDIGAGTESDRSFLRESLERALAGRRHVDIGLEPSPYNDLVITVIHPRLP